MEEAARAGHRLQPVLQRVEAKQRPPAAKGLWAMFESLRLCDGVVQRAWKEPATGEERWQVVVPNGLQEAVLKAMHGAAGSGHCGVTKTFRCLRQSFFWGHFRRDVKDFCRRCDPCLAREGPTGHNAPLQQLPVGAPMERVAEGGGDTAYVPARLRLGGELRTSADGRAQGRHFLPGELVWAPAPRSTRRRRRPPGRFRDFVCPLGVEGLFGGRQM